LHSFSVTLTLPPLRGVPPCLPGTPQKCAKAGSFTSFCRRDAWKSPLSPFSALFIPRISRAHCPAVDGIKGPEDYSLIHLLLYRRWSLVVPRGAPFLLRFLTGNGLFPPLQIFFLPVPTLSRPPLPAVFRSFRVNAEGSDHSNGSCLNRERLFKSGIPLCPPPSLVLLFQSTPLASFSWVLSAGLLVLVPVRGDLKVPPRVFGFLPTLPA